jgi:hypothetical protein
VTGGWVAAWFRTGWGGPSSSTTTSPELAHVDGFAACPADAREGRGLFGVLPTLGDRAPPGAARERLGALQPHHHAGVNGKM